MLCTIMNSSLNKVIHLFKIWIEMCKCSIGEVIVHSRNKFVFQLCFRFNMRRFSTKIYFLLHTSQCQSLFLYLCSVDFECDHFSARFFVFPYTVNYSNGYLLRDVYLLTNGLI